MRALPCTLLLAACATTPVQGDHPSRRAVADALVTSLVCEESETVVCHNQPRRAVLTSLRCTSVAGIDRILCRYAGRMSWMDGTRGPIPSECAHLARNTEGRWRIEYYPDSDVCGG